jgi:hypothetical protein
MSKKTPAKRKNSKIEIPPGAVIYGEAKRTKLGDIPAITVHGIGGFGTSLTAKKIPKNGKPIEVALPSATIVGASPDARYVAVDGETYVTRETLEEIQVDDNLRLIGMVDDPKNWSPLRRDVEAFKKVKELLEQPHEAIPESLIRRNLARQYGCKPEEITHEQIRFAVSGLFDDYPTITVIPSPSPNQEANEHAPSSNAAITSEVERRAKLLADYKGATGDPSNRQIYEAKNSRIHKPEFYKWRSGKLSAESETALNFERFLRERKPPTKW